MSRKLRQVPVKLDSKGIAHLPAADLAAIMRAADPLIMSGGRTLLSKILKGSHDRKIIEQGGPHCSDKKWASLSSRMAAGNEGGGSGGRETNNLCTCA